MADGRLWPMLCAAMLVASACTGGDKEAAPGNPAPQGEGWTILQYQIGDTDLEPYLMVDVGEMGEVGSNENLTIRALIDRAEAYGDDEVLDLGSWTGGKLVQVNQGSAEVLEEMGDVNTGDPAVLSEFLSRGITENPAEKYALILSDHGASWPGVGGDESADHDSLSLEEINTAISSGLAEAGLDKLDLLGFDACLMATYEVASNLAPLADRMLASSELEPGHGWDYNALQVAADNPATTADELGTAIVDGFLAQATESGTEANVTLALIDLTKIAAVDEALSTFSSALIERSLEVAPVIGRSRPETLSYGKSPDPAQDTFMTDLGDLAAQIGIEALDVSDQADALQRAINDSVVHKIAGPAAQAFSGLSIYFPPAENFRQDYEAIETPGGWMDFLASYYGAGDAIPEEQQPTFTSGEGEVYFDEDGLNILGTFDLAAEENLSTATINYGLLNEDGSITMIGDEFGEVSNDGSGQALGIYDLTVLTITDGEDTAYGYLSLAQPAEDTELFTIDVPMAYYSPGDVEGETYQDVLLSLTATIEGDIVNETYYAYDEELGTYGELTAEPEGIIVPNVLTIDAEGNQEWTPTTDVGLFADLPNLQYDLEALESGTELYVELVVEDFGGNSDFVSAEVSVP